MVARHRRSRICNPLRPPGSESTHRVGTRRAIAAIAMVDGRAEGSRDVKSPMAGGPAIRA